MKQIVGKLTNIDRSIPKFICTLALKSLVVKLALVKLTIDQARNELIIQPRTVKQGRVALIGHHAIHADYKNLSIPLFLIRFPLPSILGA